MWAEDGAAVGSSGVPQAMNEATIKGTAAPRANPRAADSRERPGHVAAVWSIANEHLDLNAPRGFDRESAGKPGRRGLMVATIIVGRSNSSNVLLRKS